MNLGDRSLEFCRSPGLCCSTWISFCHFIKPEQFFLYPKLQEGIKWILYWALMIYLVLIFKVAVVIAQILKNDILFKISNNTIFACLWTIMWSYEIFVITDLIIHPLENILFVVEQFSFSSVSVLWIFYWKKDLLDQPTISLHFHIG